MKHLLAICLLAFGFTSCVKEEDKKPTGPVTGSSKIPWNAPQPGQGGGQLGLLPQNQYRR